MVAASLTAMEPVNNAPHSPKRRYPENDKTKKVIRVWRPKKIYEEVKVEENIHVLASDDVYCDYDGCGEPCGDIESYVAHMAAVHQVIATQEGLLFKQLSTCLPH